MKDRSTPSRSATSAMVIPRRSTIFCAISGIYELSFYVDDLLSGDKVTFYPTGEVLSVTPYNKGKAQQYTKNYTKDGKELKIA